MVEEDFCDHVYHMDLSFPWRRRGLLAFSKQSFLGVVFRTSCWCCYCLLLLLLVIGTAFIGHRTCSISPTISHLQAFVDVHAIDGGFMAFAMGGGVLSWICLQGWFPYSPIFLIFFSFALLFFVCLLLHFILSSASYHIHTVDLGSCGLSNYFYLHFGMGWWWWWWTSGMNTVELPLHWYAWTQGVIAAGFFNTWWDVMEDIFFSIGWFQLLFSFGTAMWCHYFRLSRQIPIYIQSWMIYCLPLLLWPGTPF